MDTEKTFDKIQYSFVTYKKIQNLNKQMEKNFLNLIKTCVKLS